MPSHRGYVQGLWGQVHYRADGEGRALVLIHQSPWSSMQYHAVLPLLAARGIAALAPDTPGYGLSDPAPDATIADYADNLACMIRALRLARATVSGHHTGALIAASLAARYPELVTALVLDNCPFYTAAERADRLKRPAGEVAIMPDGSHFTDRWATMRRLADPAMSDASVQLAVLAWCQAGRDAGHHAAFVHDASADIATIAAPTLLLASRCDPISGHADRIAALRPDFQRAALPGGTASVLESPGDWVSAIASIVA